MPPMQHSVSEMMARVRAARPLVHQITNYVTVNDCANATLCAGGSPVMTDAAEDVPDMASISSAVVLNMGTLNARTVESMLAAGKAANDRGIPVVFDPVGAGATPYRTAVARRLIASLDLAAIKGNCGEISVLAGLGGEVRGVDSASSCDGSDAVRSLSSETGAVVAMTGPTDYVSDGRVSVALSNGHPLLECVSGTGCMVSSVCGCYVGANGASADSVAAAISVFAIAGEVAAEAAGGPGTFKPLLLDALYNLDGGRADAALRAA